MSVENFVFKRSTHVAESAPSTEELAKRLSERPRKLHTSLCYNEIGSYCFEKLCEQPEYYLTRTEKDLLRHESDGIARLSQPEMLVDLGCGNLEKVHFLIDVAVRRQQPIRFAPCDIDEGVVRSGLEHLFHFFSDEIETFPFSTTFEECIYNLPQSRGPRLFCFLGSTVGNMSDSEKHGLFQQLQETMTEQDSFLIGVDLVKRREILEGAYNDQAGWLRGSILASLRTLREMYYADIDENKFDQRSVYDHQRRSVVSYVVSKVDQNLNIPTLNLSVTLEKDEDIEVEFSEKFVLKDELLRFQGYGMYPIQIVVHSEIPYALLLLRKMPQMVVD